MQIRALQMFVELARSDSIRQAAQRSNLAPTAVSRQIDRLEYFFRAELIDRSAAGIRLTEAGRLLAERACGLVADLDAVRAEIDDLRGLERGHVSIRAGGAVIGGLLAPVLCELHALHPGLRFSIETASTRDVLAAVCDGTADIGITMFSPDAAAALIGQRVRIDHAVIVGPEHKLARLDRVTLKQLTEHPLALPDEGFGARQDLDRIARKASIRLDPVFVTGSLDMQKELAIRGAAALVLPPLCCGSEIAAGRLRAIPLAACSTITTSLDLYRSPHRTLPYAVKTLLQSLTRFMAARLQDGE